MQWNPPFASVQLPSFHELKLIEAPAECCFLHAGTSGKLTQCKSSQSGVPSWLVLYVPWSDGTSLPSMSKVESFIMEQMGKKSKHYYKCRSFPVVSILFTSI